MTPTWTHCARLVGATLLAMCTGIAPANAFAPLERRGSDSSWSPAKQTGLPERDHPNRVGWSPRPTDAPPSQHNYGAMDLLKRDTFSIGSDTCGFLAGYSSAAVTCVKLGAYCTDDGAGNIDCCTGAYSVCKSSMLSACLDFSASLQGACGTGLGPRTLCCPQSLPSCATLLYSAAASPYRVSSLFECNTDGGLTTLLKTPPDFLVTHSASSSSSSSSSSTSTSSSSLTTSSSTSTSPVTTSGSGNGGNSGGSGDGGSSTPIGAIVGGVVGGVAVIGLAIFLVFFFVLRNRRARNNNNLVVAPPMAQGAAYGGPGQPPFAPAANPNQQPYGQGTGEQYFKPYDPNLQQQPEYNNPAGVYGAGYANTATPSTTTTAVPPPSSTSPGSQHLSYPPAPFPQQQGYPPPQGYAAPVVMNELSVQHAVGTNEHRAELT